MFNAEMRVLMILDAVTALALGIAFSVMLAYM